MDNQTIKNNIRDFVFENKVVLLFLTITAFAFYFSGLTTVAFFSELFTRFGRNTFMVLALLIPVVAGLGLNFAIVIGAMSAQIAMFIIVALAGWTGHDVLHGVSGVFLVALLATPIAIILGFLMGKMFNKMKGSEMIAGMVTNFFADGFYQFLFLFVFGGIIPIAAAQLMTSHTGVGVLNVIDLGNFEMRQALDDVSMFHILIYGFYAMIILVVCLIAYKLIKKQPLKLFGKEGLIKFLIPLALLGISYLLMLTVEPYLAFTYQNRLNGVYASRLAAIALGLMMIYQIVRHVRIQKRPGKPIKQFVYLGIVAVGFLITLLPEVANGLDHVRIPVLTYALIVAVCLFINWFLQTRLGQNMRTAGHDRNVAIAAGINVDRTRVIAMCMSTVIAAYGQIIIMQNLGVMVTYGAHLNVGLYAIAALLVGGATVARASVKHAITGVLLFHALFILAPLASANLLGQALFGEYFRMFVANAVIALALIMHAWKRVVKRKKLKAQA